MDDTVGSISDWFGETFRSVGTQVANSWADSYARSNDPAPPVPNSQRGFVSPAAKAQISQLASNPLAWVVLALLGFGLFRLTRE